MTGGGRRPTPTGGRTVLVQLIGGGWREDARDAVYGPFLDAAGRAPRVACVVLDEGDGTQQFRRWEAVLRAVVPCEPSPVLVAEGSVLDPGDLVGADALLVCGGLTPAYAAALAPVAADVRAWLHEGGRPYAGFSAGAAVAAGDALVGGWRREGTPVCPEEAGEDLEEVTVVPGLGLLGTAVDVHTGAWGTLGRAVAAVSAGMVGRVVALDEDTALSVVDGTASVVGAGAAWLVEGGPNGEDRRDRAVVRRLTAGSVVPPGR